MSGPGLTSEAQLRYLLQWFEEFSELQRDDFLPILASAQGGKPEQLAATLAALSCQDKPVSLFQCRIKLFNEWFPTWTQEERDRLVKGVTETDPDFGKKLQEIMTNGIQVNGLNGTSELHSSDHEEIDNIESQDNVQEVDDENKEELGIGHENIPQEIAATS